MCSRSYPQKLSVAISDVVLCAVSSRIYSKKFHLWRILCCSWSWCLCQEGVRGPPQPLYTGTSKYLFRLNFKLNSILMFSLSYFDIQIRIIFGFKVARWSGSRKAKITPKFLVLKSWMFLDASPVLWKFKNWFETFDFFQLKFVNFASYKLWSGSGKILDPGPDWAKSLDPGQDLD